MKYRIRTIFAIIAALMIVGCGRGDFGKQDEGGSLRADSPSPDENPAPGNNYSGDLNNDDFNNAGSPEPNQPPDLGTGSGAAVAANSALAFKAYRAMGDAGENVVLSPLGLTRSFSIATLAASDAEVQEALMTALETDVDPGTLNSSIDSTIASVSANAGAGSLALIPSVWAQTDAQVAQPFLEDLLFFHDMGVQLVDFDQPDAREQINTWFRNRSEGYIVDAVAPRAFPDATRLAFIDASYFIGTWLYGFDSEDGYDTTFAGLRQGVSVRMMRLNAPLLYAADTDSEMVVLPYDNGFSLTAILPREGSLEQVENQLSETWLDERHEATEVADVELAFPRIETTGRFDLQAGESNIDLGAGSQDPDAFANAGDSLVLGNILQRTTIRFEETQTMATSPTDEGSPVTDPAARLQASLDFDRPFIFVIRDSQTGAIVLLGRIGQPTAI